MFSYGSGLASSLFSFRITSSIASIAKNLNLHSRLQSRLQQSPTKFEEVMRIREETHGKNDLVPTGDGSPVDEALFKGTYYLSKIDEKCRREYERV
jgi:hydroxymethylglutaryl-CoA synthase